jgi:two-component system LytT family response regulator
VVIFVTAYDRYAMRAFDAHAVDYLLKPFSAQRFERAPVWENAARCPKSRPRPGPLAFTPNAW